MKTAVIDVGGGMRGIYAAGVFDRCMDDGIVFDLAIGISAGSANVASYTAGQRGRNYRFYTDYAFRKEYMSMELFLKNGSFIDLDYVYSVLSNSEGEDPLDYDAFTTSPVRVVTIATDALTGQPTYFTKRNYGPDNYDVVKASCALPFFCKPYTVNGRAYFDGALGDPVPVKRALELGCEKIVLILTKPVNRPRKPGRDLKIAGFIHRPYPAAAEALRTRAERYNEGVALARALERQGKALIVAPDDTCGVDTLVRDKEKLDAFYQKGFRDGEAIEAFLR